MAGERRSKVRTANPGALKGFLEATKYETRLLGDVQQHIIARRSEEVRDQTVLHPSEICKADWCPRASYYRLVGEPESNPSKREAGYVIINIWDEGHEVGRKYQDRLWAMGVLRGEWRCKICGTVFSALAPLGCESCNMPEALEYLEVPLFDAEHLIGGHADGDISEGNDNIALDPLVEFKTIGLGTVRVEQPGLLADHTYKVPVCQDDVLGAEDKWWEGLDAEQWGRIEAKTMVDYEGLWRAIKRPFPSHIKQGLIYCYVLGRTHMIFIYECKWNQQTKEFVVKFRPEHIADILDGCKDVKYSIQVGKPPTRPAWASPENKACTGCTYRDTCYELENHESQARRRPRTGESSSRSEGKARPRRPVAAPEAAVQGRGWPAEVAAPHQRVVRRRVDAALLSADEVD